MPITLTSPIGPGFGPGMVLHIGTDAVGPFPVNTLFRVDVFPVGSEDLAFQGQIFTQSPNNVVRTLGEPTTGTTWTQGPRPLAEGEDCTVNIVFLVNDAAADNPLVLDRKWNSTTSEWPWVSQIPALAQGQGGFTETDRANLTDVEDATTQELVSQVNPAVRVILSVADVVSGMPVNRLAAQECQSFEGRGTLTRPGGGFPVNAFGINWRIVRVPESFGRRDGAAVEYIERLAQLVVINRDTQGVTYVDLVEDIFWDNGKIAWSWNNLPFEILYDVTPGVIMQFCWLLL